MTPRCQYESYTQCFVLQGCGASDAGEGQTEGFVST